MHQHQKDQLVKDANIMALCGLAAVGLAISAAVLLVVSYVDQGRLAVIVTVFVVCLFAGLWFALPLARRRSVPAVNRGKTGLTGRLGVAAGMAVNVNETEAKYDAPAGAA